MSRVINIKKVINGCGSACPYYEYHEGGLMGSYKMCNFISREIVKSKIKDGFPTWCHLKKI